MITTADHTSTSFTSNTGQMTNQLASMLSLLLIPTSVVFYFTEIPSFSNTSLHTSDK